MQAFWSLLRRDIRLAFRQGGAIGTALGFYLVVITILPLGLGPQTALLGKLAPALLWVALLLSALLSVDRIFHDDFEDGSLEVITLGGLPLELIATAKALAHWITTGIPLVLMAPVLGLLLNLDGRGVPVLLLTMLIGTPAVSFLGSLGAALTLGIRRGGLLLSLLILPLFVPVLIFGVGTIDAALVGPGSPVTPLLLLIAVTLVTVAFTPIAAAAALRAHMQ